MTGTTPLHGLELRSLATGDGQLRLSLEDVTPGEPGPDELLVRVEAAPINPSDLGLLIGPADMATARSEGTPERPVVLVDIPGQRLGAIQARLGQSLAVGNEGAGTVVKAGGNVRKFLGRKVGMLGGGMYAQLRRLPARDCILLPEFANASDGASMFVNPLTALGFTETMKAEGHRAIVHTAAASNLGQMLNRICLKDGIPLVNIVRSEAQAELLRGMGARHVVDSTSPGFQAELTQAIRDTGATIAFDAIGGGTLAGQILQAMEACADRSGAGYSPYGSNAPKQVYIYGSLDMGPTVLNRTFGFTWSVGGWLLFPFLQKAGREVVARMRQRVADELTTTFASRYTRTISLRDALSLDILREYERKATGGKYLIDPSL
ncbi:zinc-binding dehydrogenase [Luteimonas sp. MC1825]|uniref:zinc-binding dehydrogenase n=1 Tax=Luteimonas sp. MC1825 TaxID=2761107 RepID=UPI00161AB6C9|nr:zinc-binding dehydrogenase [Luteimonas sp. MC1825]MBB6598224.1 zinc-binding dehydrogenase [Luteimonas sp. MC1825]QOC88443.1 zinc-binding dehydrogenase [Luteimonas sp. MC1825]